MFGRKLPRKPGRPKAKYVTYVNWHSLHFALLNKCIFGYPARNLGDFYYGKKTKKNYTTGSTGQEADKLAPYRGNHYWGGDYFWVVGAGAARAGKFQFSRFLQQ
jgi:hypothetical protein